MTKTLKSFKGEEKAKVIKRRIAGKTGGLGYLSAISAERQGALNKQPVESPAVEAIEVPEVPAGE